MHSLGASKWTGTQIFALVGKGIDKLFECVKVEDIFDQKRLCHKGQITFFNRKYDYSLVGY